MINVSNEIGVLKRVIIHKPDFGISRVSPQDSERLLFDDIVYYPDMVKEHQVFVNVLEQFLGSEQIYDTQQLLEEAISVDKKSKGVLLANVLKFEELPSSYYDLLDKLSDKLLAEVLITGFLNEEDHILFDPIPNFIFTRDIAVTVNDHMIITKASKEARHRENLLTSFILRHHPIFKVLTEQNKIVDLNDIEAFPPSRKGEHVSMEGGDMMIINGDYLLVGVSIRTTDHAINSLKKVLFDKGIIKYVVKVRIPENRSFMHIDTLFTRVSQDHIVCYKPIVYDGIGSIVEVESKNEDTRLYYSIKDFFLKEINPDMNFIFAGGGESPYQEREQWTDGCNLVALRNGIGITYDRNPKTQIAFENAGYSFKSASEFLEDIALGKYKISDLENTIITIPSHELSRARGGSHCMTCPIERGII